MMQWFMWACRRESHLREILITSLPSSLLQGVCGGFKNHNYLELLLINFTTNLLGLVKHMQIPPTPHAAHTKIPQNQTLAIIL